MSKRYLGTLKCAVKFDPKNGEVDVDRDTKLSQHLSNMQTSMSREEMQEAVRLRSAACQAVAAFFLFVNDPDRKVVTVAPEEK